MTDKRKSHCTAATVTGAREKSLNNYFTPEYDECQAEQIFRRDFRALYIGALAILVMYTIARIAGWIG